MNKFKEKLSLVPNKPGSYQMKDKDGVIIYVGKAKDLQKRLRSYFTRTVTGKTKLLVDDIEDFEYIVTNSELESLILEINLIKKYDPKYNILLRDDKSYPYIELTNDKYPILKVVRNVKRKKNKNYLYGPYPNVKAARDVVNMINRVYPLRKCERLKKDYCLYYHIGECLGYCKNDIDKELIDNMKKEIIMFLKGDSSIISKKIKDEMEKASNSMNYEKALEFKNMLDNIDIVLNKQKIDLNNNYNFDMINYYCDNNYVSIEIFFIRNGLLNGRSNEIIPLIGELDDLVIEYLIKFYENNLLPKELYVCDSINLDLLNEYFDIKTFNPKKGKLKKLLDMCYLNAKEQMDLKEESIKNSDVEREKAILELSNLLGCKVSRMESFDNSHLFGTYYVGGMVVFNDFVPDKNSYRKYKINSGAKDDISAMREVLYRRYFKVLMEEDKTPDLIVMDGGKSQVNICKSVLQELNLNIPIIGLVKDSKHNTNHIINSDLEVLDVKNDSKLFLFLSKIQEEVHRYAITYHRNIKSKGTLSSILDMVPGIGEVRKKELLKNYGSLKKIREANEEDLIKILGKDVTDNLIKYLKDMED